MNAPFEAPQKGHFYIQNMKFKAGLITIIISYNFKNTKIKNDYLYYFLNKDYYITNHSKRVIKNEYYQDDEFIYTDIFV